MAIWFRDYSLDEVNARCHGNLGEHLGIRITALGDDSLTGEMPVDHRTKQPYGLLHGGASVALAETLASMAANLTLDPKESMAVGLEINANHLRSVTSGNVTGIALPLHRGRSTQVWEVQIRQGEHLVCISRMTAAIIPTRRA
jgi:1,4-dihydroxy-2-naphthoyl-CoA hydrolase